MSNGESKNLKFLGTPLNAMLISTFGYLAAVILVSFLFFASRWLENDFAGIKSSIAVVIGCGIVLFPIYAALIAIFAVRWYRTTKGQ